MSEENKVNVNETKEELVDEEIIKEEIINDETINKAPYSELSDTVDLMNSKDYKDRFKAEYLQTKIRFDKLSDMLIKFDAGTLDFEPTCTREVLDDQVYYMNEYLRVLKIRAEIEGIDLKNI